MAKVNTNLLFACYLSSVLLLLGSCRKQKEPVVHHFQGRLLLSNTNPIPVPSYTLEFHQSQTFSGPFPISASGSSVTTTTDAQGNFRCDFTTGETRFMGRRQGSNPNQIYLEGQRNTSFTHFLKANIPQDNMGDIYLCKKIDSLVITIDAQWGLLPSDTIEVIYNTQNDNLRKRKSGLSAPIGATNVIFDTIYNVAFSYFDFKTGMYSPNLAVYHVNHRSTQPFYIEYNSYNKPNMLMEPGDEKKRIVNLR